MGAKPSTANGTQSPRTRAFSTSSSSEVVTAPGFRFMRSLGMDMSNDRQRARSLSSVPDLHASHEALSLPPTGASFDVSTGASPETDSSSAEEAASVLGLGSTAANIALGRVYAAHSLPSHIWSLNGIKCPVCSKFVIPDDIECHLVMCLTKPRLSYNEDVLTDDKGECVICLEELCKGDVIARLPCLCIYHKTCIDQWFDVNRSCPEHPGD
ncbi:E3 ubiquitin-protein ligase ZNRF1 isoform X1 [Leptinotarsa decemlineata]|uniref:E3 ubiquitin-protein ligase ZNRF1 isoform X1 n=1 Tax=Leptinotarsa decemlineata TaxID=7539 RepID=UPI000C2526AE|nr:E3 ubiquitin-protein ligase ZNRF1 [Leptinotarsa decemlineata]